MSWKKTPVFEDKTKNHHVYTSFFFSERSPSKMKAYCSIGILITDDTQEIIILKRGYFIGFKEPFYAKLIGIAYVLKLLKELEIFKISLYSEKGVIKKFLKDYFDELDPFQEKTAILIRRYLSFFESIVYIYNIKNSYYLQAQD